MIAEHITGAVVLAIAAAAVEGYQVAARVVVFGVAAVGGFFVMREGIVGGFAVDDGLDSVAVSIISVFGSCWLGLLHHRPHCAFPHSPVEAVPTLEVRIERQKAVVAIVRKTLISCLAHPHGENINRHGSVEQIAAWFFAHPYRIGIVNLPKGMSARQYVRFMLDRVNIGEELTRFKWGSKWVTIPPSPGRSRP